MTQQNDKTDEAAKKAADEVAAAEAAAKKKAKTEAADEVATEPESGHPTPTQAELDEARRGMSSNTLATPYKNRAL